MYTFYDIEVLADRYEDRLSDQDEEEHLCIS